MGLQSVEATNLGRDQKNTKAFYFVYIKQRLKVWADLYLADFLSLRSYRESFWH